MPKLDKKLYSKQEYKNRKTFLKQQKQQSIDNLQNDIVLDHIAFVLGNGISRKPIDENELLFYGKVYGCNAIYRTFTPDYLVAVDVKMVIEINETGYQKKNIVWTNPNRAYDAMEGFNYFKPNKGWSSGPTALWLASGHEYNKIYILGFDYMGLNLGKHVNNIYVDTKNYKKSTDGATYYGNWLRQTQSTIKQNTNIQYIRVLQDNAFDPKDLTSLKNYSILSIDLFKKMFCLT